MLFREIKSYEFGQFGQLCSKLLLFGFGFGHIVHCVGTYSTVLLANDSISYCTYSIFYPAPTSIFGHILIIAVKTFNLLVIDSCSFTWQECHDGHKHDCHRKSTMHIFCVYWHVFPVTSCTLHILYTIQITARSQVNL